MIKNEKQYRISNKKLNDLTEKIHSLQASKSLKSQLTIASLTNLQKQLKTEIKEYDSLKFGKRIKAKERSIAELPSIITEYKIAHNLTQKEFSQKLGLKEQQLQRYEAEGFKTVSFQNLLKFISLINLDLKVKETTARRLSVGRRVG